MSETRFSRRYFFYGSLLAGAVPAGGFGSTPSRKAAGFKSVLDKLNVAGIGIGGRGGQDIATATVKSDGARKGSLWLGLSGNGTVELNGRQIMKEEGLTRFRTGQFQQAVELRLGENQFVFRVQPANGKAALSALLVGQENNGDSLEGAIWTA